jgi:hypothetical protein
MEKDEVWDWAGVEGEWCGSYAFLEYAPTYWQSESKADKQLL